MDQDRLFHHEDLVPDPAIYDLILTSASGGKDSRAMTDLVVELTGEAKVPRANFLTNPAYVAGISQAIICL